MSFLANKLALDPSDFAGAYNNLVNALFSVSTITANNAASQATATAMPSAINRISASVATGSVIMPVSTPGSFLTVINDTANAVNVYPQVGDKLNALAANAAFSLAAGKSADCYCAVAGTWHIVLSA